MRRLRRLIVVASLVAAPVITVSVASPANATCDPRKPSGCYTVCVIREPVKFPANCM